MRIYKLLFSFIILAIPLLLVSPVKAASVEPTKIDGNPVCGAGFLSVKFDPPNSGTKYIGGKAITMTTDGTYVDWTSEIPIDYVLVKGGSAANMYAYSLASTGDTGLHSPENPSGRPAGVSHVTFCFVPRLLIDKTVETSLKRTWDWTIEKMLKDEIENPLQLAKGQSYFVDYLVKLTANHVDSDWKVWGTITIDNPWPLTANVTNVTDVISDSLNAEVNCVGKATLAFLINSGGSVTCDYERELPNDSTRTNVATVYTTGTVLGNSVSKSVDFASATVNKEDDCVDVDDDKFGSLGEVCATGIDEFEEEIPYSMEVDSNICDESEFTNTASFVTNTSETTKKSSVTINIFVDCVFGCTLTQGYWKTHSEFGPASHDSTWSLLHPEGASKTFFLSGMSYHKVMWTPPAGNAYYNLAHQYIAAEMNTLNDADMPVAVQTAFDSATTLFNTYTPAQVKALKANSPIRKQFIELAGILGAYNEGMKGVPHCDEDVKIL